MPRRVNPMRQMLVDAQKRTQVEPAPEQAALPPAPEPEKPFDFNTYLREVRASKITCQLKGKHYANSRKGRQFADELFHHMLKGEELEIAKIKDKFTFNQPPSREAQLANYVAQLDSGLLNRSGLF